MGGWGVVYVVLKIKTYLLVDSFVHVFKGVVDFGMWFAVFRRCVSMLRGFVLGPFNGVEGVYVLVSPVVCVEGDCIVVGVFRGIPFVAPVLVPVPPM